MLAHLPVSRASAIVATERSSYASLACDASWPGLLCFQAEFIQLPYRPAWERVDADFSVVKPMVDDVVALTTRLGANAL